MIEGESQSPARRPGRLLGLDVGDKRIGVAVSDESGTLATPLRYVSRGQRDQIDLEALVREWKIERLIVGLPTGMSGREGPQAANVRAYAETLALALELPVVYWDERLTTAIAERQLIADGVRLAQRRERIDAAAAAVILQDYLDAQRYQRRATRP
ncbi:MAG: Holliday junction resolvase RuvX [Chloroflexota bacterium]|nr:Holliday junction resolvase RuvX [Chloroflexota bacterium]